MPVSESYRTTTSVVANGEIAVGEWGDPGASPVIALHGVMGSHRVWERVARVLQEDYFVVAPDLRGRSGSADAGGPYGFAQHVRDVEALMDARGIDSAVLIGHSMGGFLAVAIAVALPDRVTALVLADGGLPPVAANANGDEVTTAVMSGIAAELDAEFPHPTDYVEARRRAMRADLWDDDLADARAYELRVDGGVWKVAGAYDAVVADVEHITGAGADSALRALTCSATLLHAGKGLPPRPEPLYPAHEIAQWERVVASLTARGLPDEDHDSIVLSDAGVSAVCETVREMTRDRG